MEYKHNKKLRSNAQKLRREMTREERHLWYDFLRPHPVAFKRQQILGHYIVDFYCAKAKLVIELDGFQHGFPENEEKDAERTAFLAGYDLTVLRFSNWEINMSFDTVCRTIDSVLKDKLGYDPYAEEDEVSFGQKDKQLIHR